MSVIVELFERTREGNERKKKMTELINIEIYYIYVERGHNKTLKVVE
jgi:hypothetical protein